MNLLRKCLLVALAALAFFGPMTALPKLEANPSHSHGTAHNRVFYVYYRTCPHDTWHCYGGYYHSQQAQQAATWFRYNGYEVFVR